MTTSELISAALGSVAGVTGTWATWKISKNKDRRDDFDKIMEVWESDNSRLRDDIKTLSSRIDTLEVELTREKRMNADLQNKLILLESAHHDLPFPQWLKDTNGKMLSLNKAYEDYFLIPMGKRASDYIGHTDEDIWGAEIAAQFAINDKAARRERGYWIGNEPMLIKGSDISKLWKVVKYSRMVGGVIVGVAGIAIPID